jgi:hypothetical protein
MQVAQHDLERARTSAIHMAMEKAVREVVVPRRHRWKAETPATTKEPVRTLAQTMCARR